MSVRPEFRWWILTLAIVGGLLAISALALDRPNVIWSGGEPFCPHCRSRVALYSQRCPSCRERYDWIVAPEDRSPRSPYTLSPLEARHLRDRIQVLGEDEAAARVAARLALPAEVAARYLARIGSGQCGLCGGTGVDLAAEADAPCPVCFGEGRCVSCGRMRRVRVGDEAAHLALVELEDAIHDLGRWVPRDVQRDEVARLSLEFLRRFAGTREAQRLPFWPAWEGELPGDGRSAVQVARHRIDEVLAALAGDD